MQKQRSLMELHVTNEQTEGRSDEYNIRSAMPLRALARCPAFGQWTEMSAAILASLVGSQ